MGKIIKQKNQNKMKAKKYRRPVLAVCMVAKEEGDALVSERAGL